MDAERKQIAMRRDELAFARRAFADLNANDIGQGRASLVDAGFRAGDLLADALEAALEREAEALKQRDFDYKRFQEAKAALIERDKDALAAGSSSLRNPTQDDPDALADALNDAQFPDGPFDVPIPGGNRIARGGAARSETEETPT